MRLLRWAALDGNSILALETFSLIYLFISGISGSCFTAPHFLGRVEL